MSDISNFIWIGVNPEAKHKTDLCENDESNKICEWSLCCDIAVKQHSRTFKW